MPTAFENIKQELKNALATDNIQINNASDWMIFAREMQSSFAKIEEDAKDIIDNDTKKKAGWIL